MAFRNTRYGKIPHYWKIPVQDEVYFVTKDSGVFVPKLLLIVAFPDFCSFLCDHCINAHEKITVIIEDVTSSALEEALKSLAKGNPRELGNLLELESLGSAYNVAHDEVSQILLDNVKQEPLCEEDNAGYDESENLIESFLGSSIKTEGDMADNDTENIKTMSEVNNLCVCEICGFQSEVVHDMIWHKETVHGYVTFPCNLCNFVGKKQRLLKIHKLKTHGIGGVVKYPCHNCAYKARSEKRLKKHIRLVHESKQYNCQYCDYTSKFKKRMNLHVTMEHFDKQLTCSTCDFKASDKDELKAHKKDHTRKTFKCQTCDMVFTSIKKLTNHITVEHMGIFVQCDHCSYKGKNKLNIVQHMKKEHSAEREVPVKCKFCPYESVRGISIHEKHCLFKSSGHERN